MVWKIDDPQGNESGKIKWEIVPWTRGRGLDLGCGVYKTFPHFIGVDNGADEILFGQSIKPDVRIDTCEDLSLFASGSLDFIFSSHLLEHIDYEKVPSTLKEWMRVIKRDGYLVIYIPDEDEYPKVGEPAANKDHRWNCSYDRVIECMRQAGNWALVDFQKRNQGTEYSLYFVFQKIGNGQYFPFLKKKKPEKTAAVVRYGAYGDLLQASSVLAGLKKHGYHVTLYSSPPGTQVISHDPNIDEIILQDKDQVPNHELSKFWDYIRGKYDRFVNLSESVEGSFLSMNGRAPFHWTPKARHSLMNKNYVEMQHEIAGIPHDPNIKFYPTSSEIEWARKEKQKCGSFTIVWALAGSSVHKTWPYLDRVIAGIMVDYPDAHVVFVGGLKEQILEAGWEDEKRVHRQSGRWSIRESLSFSLQADLVIGPETGVLNAVSMEPMSKVVFLSHSSHENLTRDWVNTHVLASEKTVCPGRGNNDVPACHQMHYGWDFCKRDAQTSTAQCQADISFDQAYRVIWHAIKYAKIEAA